MAFENVLDKFRQLKMNRDKAMELKEGVEDKRLISLRNQRQVQLNEMEKKQLINDIREYNTKKMRRELFGIKDDGPVKKGFLIEKINKSNSFLVDKRPLLKEKNKNIDLKLI